MPERCRISPKPTSTQLRPANVIRLVVVSLFRKTSLVDFRVLASINSMEEPDPYSISFDPSLVSVNRKFTAPRKEFAFDHFLGADVPDPPFRHAICTSVVNH